MHYFQNPSHAEDGPACLDKFPKRLHEQLKICGGRLTELGWGLSLEEGWDQFKAWCVALVTFALGSALWGILWTVFEKNIQDAFAVSGYMISFAVVTVGLSQAMVEKYC